MFIQFSSLQTCFSGIFAARIEYRSYCRIQRENLCSFMLIGEEGFPAEPFRIFLGARVGGRELGTGFFGVCGARPAFFCNFTTRFWRDKYSEIHRNLVYKTVLISSKSGGKIAKTQGNFFEKKCY